MYMVAVVKRLARREGLSVSAFAVRELSQIARQADNAALLADLPDLDVAADNVITDLDNARSKR